jgi:hypothetical protein
MQIVFKKMFDLQCHGSSIFFQPPPFYHPSCSQRYNLFHFVNAFYIGITDGFKMAQQRMICGAKQVSLQHRSYISATTSVRERSF